VQEDSGCVYHRRVRGIGDDAERFEDLHFERFDRSGEGLLRHLSGADAVSESVDDQTAGVHDGIVAVDIDRGPQGREVEQTMNRRDAPIVGFHAGYSNPQGTIDGAD